MQLSVPLMFHLRAMLLLLLVVVVLTTPLLLPLELDLMKQQLLPLLLKVIVRVGVQLLVMVAMARVPAEQSHRHDQCAG
jgi:hypothetical protein